MGAPYFSSAFSTVSTARSTPAQKPRPVVDAITRGYADTYATVHRGVYQRSADMTLAYEDARAKVARFIGAGTIGAVMRLQRDALTEVFAENYILTARAKGLRPSALPARSLRPLDPHLLETDATRGFGVA